MKRQLFQMEEIYETAMDALMRVLFLVQKNLLEGGELQTLRLIRLFPKTVEIEEKHHHFTITAYFGSSKDPGPEVVIEADFLDYSAFLSGPPIRFLARWKDAKGEEHKLELKESTLRELILNRTMRIG